MTQTTPREPPAERLPRLLKACWKQGCSDLSALVGQPVKFRSEAIDRVPLDALEAAIPEAGVFCRVTTESEPPIEFRIVFSTALTLILSGVLNVLRPEEVQARVEAAALEANDLNAAGQLSHILASAFEESLRLDSGTPLHLTCHEIQASAEAGQELRRIEVPELMVQRLTLAVAGMGEGTIFLFFPATHAEELAGGPWDRDEAPREEAAAPAPRPAGRAVRGVPPAPASPRAGADDFDGGDAGVPRVLLAGPVPLDMAVMEEAFVLQGVGTTSCPRLRDIGVSVDPAAFDLLVLVIPPGSLGALPLLRELAADDRMPPVVVATRRATPSAVFQAVRAGAAYVVVLPPEDGAMQRVMELASATHRAAA